MDFTKLVKRGSGFGGGGLKCFCCVPKSAKKKALRSARKIVNRNLDIIVNDQLQEYTKK